MNKLQEIPTLKIDDTKFSEITASLSPPSGFSENIFQIFLVLITAFSGLIVQLYLLKKQEKDEKIKEIKRYNEILPYLKSHIDTIVALTEGHALRRAP